jgi:hypothetical protein
MGPESAKSYPGYQAIHATVRPAQRASQEIDDGRRGKGYVFGALRPVTGAALTHAYTRRPIANWIAFLEQVDAWIDPNVARISAILDNRNTHHAEDVRLVNLTHPRWEFVFQPVDAA